MMIIVACQVPNYFLCLEANEKKKRINHEMIII